ncbi:MAG: substrate-binding domain-containing protein [Albidovulum sp.]|nr:substrate-binding domain-containing protein [Albidovulum sp.]MDE0306311.1 substrate-binding domain-containing protein [Albidovulum sp.]MDE0531352.1 substrate-binding domain-containing protein [Albidovulum sp.]
MKKLLATAAALGAFASSALALDPGDLKGQQVSADDYAALISAAKEAKPPRNGENYVFGFANLQRDIPFCVKTEEGIEANASAAGIELLVTDNRLDGATALQNAQSYVQRDVDYVIEFQTDAHFGTIIMNGFNEAGIGVTAIDIPMPGATFFGANNPRSGYMGGVYLAQAAIAEWGAEMVNNGYLVVGELPQSGPIPAMRTGGQIAGFLAIAEGFPEDHVILIDTKNTLQESFTQMNNVIGRIPEGVPIMGLAINDQSITGMLRATTQAGRADDSLFVGMGADEIETLVTEPRFIASVGYFPERYGNYLVPIALMELAGIDVPPAVLVNHVIVNEENVCEYYDTFSCGEAPGFTYEFPQEDFEAHLAGLRDDPDLQGVENLIPSS